MKTTSNNLFSQLSVTSLNELTKEVKESVATDINLVNHKTFSSADLWNIQRQRKSRVQRRFL